MNLMSFRRKKDLKIINISDQLLINYKISEREKDIIALIIKGYLNKEIADKLFISKRTVDNHIYNIYQKTNVKNRVELTNLFKNN